MKDRPKGEASSRSNIFLLRKEEKLSRENGKQTCMKDRPKGEARSRSNTFLLRKEKTAFQRKREANVHEKFALGAKHVRVAIYFCYAKIYCMG